ncbi:MAG: large-conductance mechanosensitive channel protein MscL [Oscillibacter sp.]|nr:large-conductance mechanosensitive channel protein MscL [Oscillibacter sp.]
MVAEFKEFIMRGNVLDMAVGVIIATAFGKITTSLVNDIFMPLISWIFGARDMTALNVIVRPAEVDADGEVVKEAITLGFGTFVATVIDFVLVALVVFAIVKSFNKAHELAKKKKEEAPAEEPAPPEPTKEELLLTEIRDLLKKQ